MNNFEKLKSMSIKELVELLDDNFGFIADAPWDRLFSEKYCKNCEPIMCHYEGSTHEFPCAWCELNDDKCKFFPKMDKVPNNKEIIKMWLETEVEE